MPPAPSPVRILLVDDHHDTLRLLKRILEMHGYAVRAAGSLGEAVRAGAEQDYDVLVTDLSLGDGSGIDLLHELRRRRPLPGVAVTGHGEEHFIRACHQAGFAKHLLKPLGVDALLSTIHEVAANEPRRNACRSVRHRTAFSPVPGNFARRR
jgi:CheY-like chemotaxis protein